jgi:hypothetical protein
MRRLLLLVTLAALLTAGLAGSALAGGASGVELTNGKGRAVLTLRGALLGTLDQGRILVRVDSLQTEVHVDGDRLHQRTLRDGRLSFSGTNLRFRVFKGTWRVVIDGNGIDASAGGRGIVSVRGSGLFSVDGQPPQAWTSQWQAVRLGPRS